MERVNIVVGVHIPTTISKDNLFVFDKLGFVWEKYLSFPLSPIGKIVMKSWLNRDTIKNMISNVSVFNSRDSWEHL